MANWERLAEHSQAYSASDFQNAAYRLMTDQVLYAGDRGSRVPYDIIVKHLSTYRDLLQQLGMNLVHNHLQSYLVATPNLLVAEKMRLSETRLALVLRRLYDDKMHATEIVSGDAFIDLTELERAYKDLLNRELPDLGDLKDLLRAMKRYGIARIEEVADDQPFQIIIRPGIAEVIGETVLLQLAAYAAIDNDREADDEAA